MVVKVYNEDSFILQMVSLVAVALMRVQVHNHYFSYSESSAQVMNCQGNIRIDAKSSAVSEASVMEAAGKID